ncbi:hypothetical protein J7F03_11135 [Streptomyces sp. ISL-43]|uniref:hypothetical protein n=1 Tax=Streptomyces sp. ISL-43 TaxID=2819183 RepID=UPI001BEADB0D|nr:hypothetical protein [Streptomyces sp. ISL-43]MBT2447622.1 hypothetical protein [Streptomyces sp. ISL-43]
MNVFANYAPGKDGRAQLDPLAEAVARPTGTRRPNMPDAINAEQDPLLSAFDPPPNGCARHPGTRGGARR